MENVQMGPTISKYGLIGGVILSILFLIMTLSGMAQSGSTMGGIMSFALNLGVLIAIVILAIKQQRDHLQGGFITLGQSVLVGTGTLALAGLIVTVISLMYTNFIDPTYMERMMELAEEKWEEQGLTEEQIEQARGWTMTMKNPVLGAAVSLACYGVGGSIVSLIAGLIMKKEKPEFS